MKRHIAIICGGDSSEYEVSMRSAQGLYTFFDKERYEVHIVEQHAGSWHVHIDGGVACLDLNDFSYCHAGSRRTFDYAYITIHGAPGENGVLQGYLDLLAIPYSTGGVLVEALTFNKYVLNNYLRAFGFSVARSVRLYANQARPSDEELLRQIGLPCFVKPTSDGSSYGITKVHEREALAPALARAFGENDEVMVEEFLDGVELSQGAYHKRGEIVVLPATEVVSQNEFFDYDAKYNGQVEEITPARIASAVSASVAATTERIYHLLHCNGIIRVDYILSRGADGRERINILEVNTTPGMTATSFIPQQVRAAGQDITAVLTTIVENAF